MSEYKIIPMERRVDVQIVAAGRNAGFREFPSVAAAQAWIDAQTSSEEGNAVGAEKWARTPYGYVKGQARIDDNGGGLGPAKGSGRWAVTWAGWWVANVDTLAEAKRLADDQAERAS